MLSELRFCSFLAYSPRGTTPLSGKSRAIVRRLKTNAPIGQPPEPSAEFLARRMVEEFAGTELDGILGDSATLVPVPRSALSGDHEAPWPAMDLADALVRQGFGDDVLPCLTRRVAVPKAAFAGPGGRPTPQVHRASLGVPPGLLIPNEVVLIDDVVTSGSQFMGAAWALEDARPGIRVSAFAAVKTVSDGEVETLIAPTVGTITLAGERTRRRP